MPVVDLPPCATPVCRFLVAPIVARAADAAPGFRAPTCEPYTMRLRHRGKLYVLRFLCSGTVA